MTEKIGIRQLKNVIGQVLTLPTASSELVGRAYQYIGTTTGAYQHGYIYECVAETQTETLIMFDPVGTGKLAFDYTNHSVYELFERIAALTTPTFDSHDIVSGSFRLDKANELWYISGYDADNNALFTDFTVEATGGEYCLDGYGYIYTFPFPDDYEDGHEEDFRIVENTHSIYEWQRVDVQPGGSRGRFLALWNCATGLAESDPPISPYEYKTGDYFIVGTVGSTNYKPDGTAYVIGTASTTVETKEVALDDTYFFDGTEWKLQSNSNKTVSFSAIAGNIYDNVSATTALNAKANGINRINGAPLSNITSNFFGVSDTAAATVQKEVTIPSVTTLDEGTVILVKPTVTSTVANSTLKLNDFEAYPMRYNNGAISTSTDSIVWAANVPSFWIFDGAYWIFAGHGLDSNTTYIMNYTLDAGRYKAGTGTYAVTRYSLLMEKADGTWEKITATNANYSTGTSKNVNTNGFRLNHIRWYNTTAAVANGALIATNTLQNKAASVILAYSANCGTAPGWAVGDYIYLVGTIGADGLFYLDTTQWWSNALPNTNDGKLYIRLGIALTTTDSTMSFFDDRPIFYHDGTKICEYKGILSELKDTNISNPTNGQVLMWNGSAWINTTSTASVGFSAITGEPYDNTALADALNNIDCGTLP